MHNDIDRDLYEILGVARDAGPEEIKKAYRSKARECHPDVVQDPDAEYRFKELTFAYEVLSEPGRRRDYDAFGLDGLRRGAGIDPGSFTSFADLFDMFFGDAFGGPLGRRRTGRSPRPGRDMQEVVTITLEEVLAGTERELSVYRLAVCEACGGSGVEPGATVDGCRKCSGTGQVTVQRRSILGTFVTSSTCTDCGGTGELPSERCGGCGGDGRKRARETISVKIPPGVERGDHLRVPDKGEAGVFGGRSGDLYVGVDVKEDRRFVREGSDLGTVVRVEMTDAALGREVEVEGIGQDHTMKVPPGTQPGDIIKIKGKGLPSRGGGRRGDLHVRVDVTVPSKLNSEQKKILEQFRQARSEKVRR